ncbi:hypothetical protein [Acinetobacter sp. ANC 4177]|uniref:hypothetical protein n=1 Tax=Acinetobacter sp. ANC 4177 TaxID=2529838 RepID=UPI00103D3C0C|nr:hypothetical protein [Acinetobacter sp. ANC 4177]TCB72930.1 hypothetical protein E0H91_14190 [Acinetobacter sp. ANC 4177]
MGFWSSVGSAISSAARSVGSAVSSAASKVWNTAKNAARKAVDWMADEAENFVGKVKDVWKTAKPWVEKIAPYISKGIALLPFPWAGAVSKAVEKGIQALLALENSPILKKVEQAIIWASNAAKHFRDMYMTPKDVKEAEQRQQDLQEAMDAMKTEEQRQSIRFAAVINDYVLVQTHIQEILEKDTIKDFSHYLRLRATQKLLRAAEKTLNTARTLDEITADDSFLLRVGADLLAENPNLSDTDAEKLDSIIKRRFNGKSLIPFVFEELICAWETKLQNMEAKWGQMNKEAATLKRQIKELEVKMQIESLTSIEEAKLVDLKNDAKNMAYQLNQQADENRAMQSYVHAAEGFLQVLEKTAEQFEEEGRDYIVDDVATVGRLLVECAQHGKQWNELTEEEQSLITDYANIFAEDSKKRTQELVEAEV